MSVQAYIEAARDAGCPPDQVRNFLRANLVLTPPQLRAAAHCRQCDRPDGPTDVGYGGARGGGKSHFWIAQAVCDDMIRFPGLKGLYLRKVGKAGKEAVEDLRRDVLHSTPHEWTSGILKLANGSRLIVGHFRNESDIDAYLGLQYDFALIEEATQISESKRDKINTCVRSAKPGWRPRKYYGTNPGGVGHSWFKRLFIDPMRRGKERLTRFVQATVRDNPFVNPEYRTSLEALTGWLRKAWLDGDWDVAAGMYFTTWSHDHHVREIKIGKHWPVWMGFDYGYRHNTYASPQTIDGDGNVYILDEHCRNRTLIPAHAKALDAMLARHGLPKHRISKVAAGHDVFSARPNGSSVAKDYAAHGWTLTEADVDRINGAAELLKLLGDPREGIEPRLFVSPRCARLIECLPTLVHDDHRPEDVLKVDADEDGRNGDDPYDGVRYGVMARQRKVGSPVSGGARPTLTGTI